MLYDFNYLPQKPVALVFSISLIICMRHFQFLALNLKKLAALFVNPGL